jgi:hypothetical protein
MIVSKAVTAKEMQDDIVKYLKYQSTQRSSQARIAKSKKAIAGFTLQAETFEFAAKQIEAIVIEH